MITVDQIRQRLIFEIQSSGISQREIAIGLGVSEPTVSQYMSGRAMPSLETFANLCKLLDLDPSYLLCIKD
ncbi:helix-turn-helix domain-containing protein [Anaerocaecibacter muris]|uniref:helix-turn-helix domain-containing protein n=1 Tax=Anaerocaecibacter muris TaxID=2941513 RepID=UPI003B8482ED